MRCRENARALVAGVSKGGAEIAGVAAVRLLTTDDAGYVTGTPLSA